MSSQKIFAHENMRKDHNTQKKCVKISQIRFKEVIFPILCSKARILRILWKILCSAVSACLPLLETVVNCKLRYRYPWRKGGSVTLTCQCCVQPLSIKGSFPPIIGEHASVIPFWELYTIAPNFQFTSGGCLRRNLKIHQMGLNILQSIF